MVCQTALLCEWHLALDAPEGFGAGETVTFFEAGNLGFSIGSHNDSNIHPVIDPGFEEEGHIIDHDGVRIISGGFFGEPLLFTGDTRMDDLFQLCALGRTAKHDGSKPLPMKSPVGVQHILAECLDDFAPGRFAGLHNLTGQYVGIDHHRTTTLEHCGNRALPRCHPAGQSNEDHGSEAYRSWSRRSRLDDCKKKLTILLTTSHKHPLTGLIPACHTFCMRAWIFTLMAVASITSSVLADEPIAGTPKTITVALDGSGDFTSIQEAVDSAHKGDTIFLKPGAYPQDVTIHSKEQVKLVGAGTDQVTLLGHHERVGALHVGKWPYGATDIEITGMTIHDHGGHAVGIFNGKGIILRDVHVKGLLFGQEVQDVRIEDCVIGESETTGVQFADSQAVLIGNLIHHNDYGVNILGKSSVRLERNIITRNLYDAVIVGDLASATLVSNTVVKNGSGATFLGASIGDASGNILAFNTKGFVISPSSKTTLSFNALFNHEGNYLKTGTPNIPAPELKPESDMIGDPRFADLEHGDFHLSAETVLIHKGKFAYLGALPPLAVLPASAQ